MPFKVTIKYEMPFKRNSFQEKLFQDGYAFDVELKMKNMAQKLVRKIPPFDVSLKCVFYPLEFE